jgi:hypothetical protein
LITPSATVGVIHRSLVGRILEQTSPRKPLLLFSGGQHAGLGDKASIKTTRIFIASGFPYADALQIKYPPSRRISIDIF